LTGKNVGTPFGELVSDMSYDVTDGIGAIGHADRLNKDPRIRLEFVATRILDRADIEGFTPQKRLLLYSPLSVAYAPDFSDHP